MPRWAVLPPTFRMILIRKPIIGLADIGENDCQHQQHERRVPFQHVHQGARMIRFVNAVRMFSRNVFRPPQHQNESQGQHRQSNLDRKKDFRRPGFNDNSQQIGSGCKCNGSNAARQAKADLQPGVLQLHEHGAEKGIEAICAGPPDYESHHDKNGRIWHKRQSGAKAEDDDVDGRNDSLQRNDGMFIGKIGEQHLGDDRGDRRSGRRDANLGV